MTENHVPQETAKGKPPLVLRVDLFEMPFGNKRTGIWWATDADHLGEQLAAALAVNPWLSASIMQVPDPAGIKGMTIATFPKLLAMIRGDFAGQPMVEQVYGTPGDPEGRQAALEVARQVAQIAGGRIVPAPLGAGLDIIVESEPVPVARVLFAAPAAAAGEQ